MEFTMNCGDTINRDDTMNSDNIEVESLVNTINQFVSIALRRSLSPFIKKINTSQNNYKTVTNLLKQMPEFQHLLKENDKLKKEIADLKDTVNTNYISEESITLKVKEKSSNTENTVKYIYENIQSTDNIINSVTSDEDTEDDKVIETDDAIENDDASKKLMSIVDYIKDNTTSMDAEETEAEEEEEVEDEEEVEITDDEEEDDEKEVEVVEEVEETEVEEEVEVTDDEEEDEETDKEDAPKPTKPRNITVNKDSESESEDEDEDEEVYIIELELDYKEQSFYTNDEENGNIYEILKNEEIGDKVGEFVNGEPFFD